MSLATDFRALTQRPNFPGLALFALSTGLILGAWGFQTIGGLAPCPLCLEQRVPWYLMIVLSGALAAVPPGTLPSNARKLMFAIAFGLVIWSAYLGLYHAGVEYKWWPGPATCTTGGAKVDGSIGLDQLGGTKIPMCDIVPWSMFGISLAGFNFLFSLVGVALAGLGLATSLREKS
jgi:disulfide bond formation protein DsbB